MRRKELEVKAFGELLEIITSCLVCRLGFMDQEGMYIVPLNFGYCEKDGRLTLYFHSASEGRKINALAGNPVVCFEMDCGHRLTGGGEIPCKYSYSYKSIIGTGEASIITSPEEKKTALSCLMKHQTGRDFTFTGEMAGGVTVFKVEVTGMTGKYHS